MTTTKHAGKSVKSAKSLAESFGFAVGNRVSHPTLGTGRIVGSTPKEIIVEWDRLFERMNGLCHLVREDANHLVKEQEYTDDLEDADVDKIDEQGGSMECPVQDITNKVEETKMAKNKKAASKKKNQLDEMWMTGIPGTIRGASNVRNEGSVGITWGDLMEEEMPVPDTASSPHKPGSSEPFSSIEGFDAAETDWDPSQTLDMPSDALDTPSVKKLEGAGDGVPKSTGSSKKSSSFTSDSGSSESSESESSESSESESSEDSGKPWEKKAKTEALRRRGFAVLTESEEGEEEKEEEGEEKGEEDHSEEHEASEHSEAEETEHSASDDHEDGGEEGFAPEGDDVTVDEHNMAAGEIAVTQEFLVKLMKAVRDDSPDDVNLSKIANAIATCCSEDRTLDVADIGMVMDKLRNEGGEPEKPEFEDRAEGDGEVAGPEGGDEHEGRTKLMDCDGDKPKMESRRAKPKSNRNLLIKEEADWDAPGELDESVKMSVQRRSGIRDWWK